MIFRSFRSVLAECLDAMRLGATVQQCLARYPRHADRLLPLLTLAESVKKSPPATPRAGAREQAWLAVQTRATDLRTGRRRLKVQVVHAPPASLTWLKPLAVAAAVLFLFTAASGGLAYASQDALPDSPLYRVKLASEDVRLWFVFDDTRRAEILLDQSDQRMQEIFTLVRRGDQVPEAALSDMADRNSRAVGIMADNPEETTLRARVLTQAQEQEELLIALWPEVPDSATPEYAEAVAQLHNTRLSSGTGTTAAVLNPEDLAGGILDISGQAEQIEDGVWIIGGVEVRVDDRTIGRDGLEEGLAARFVVARASTGRLHVLSLTGLTAGTAPTGAVVSGAIEEITSAGITVAGNFIPFSSNTLRTVSLKVGDRVEVSLSSTSDGIVAGAISPAVVATSSSASGFTFIGTIEGDVSNSSTWTISGLPFDVTPSTTFDARAGSAADGSRVQVQALNSGGRLKALRVTVLASDDPPDVVAMVGNFDGYDQQAGIWRISGLSIVPPETGKDPPDNALVAIEARREGGDLVVEEYVTVESPDDPALVQVQGTIIEIDGSRWTLEFAQVRVDSTVAVTGDADEGERALLWGERGRDGGIQARYVIVLDEEPVLLPTVSPATPAPSPTPAP